jgi:hypothetical protein
MPTIITAGDASNGLAFAAGNDGAVTIQSGLAGAKVNALGIAADGKLAILAAGGATQAEMESGTSALTLVTPARQHFHQSAAKVWCNFNGIGAIAINSSYNVTSLTDNGVGDYSVNYTTALSSGGCAVATANTNDSGQNDAFAGVFTISTTGSRIRTYDVSAGGLVDMNGVSLIVFGDI